MGTIFEKIIRRELPSEKVFESSTLIAIKDINPQAPVHLLIIPKKVYPSLQEIPKEDLSVMEEIIEVTQALSLIHI